MEENNIIEMEEVMEVNQENQEVDTCEEDSNNGTLLLGLFGVTCGIAGALALRAGEWAIPKVASGVKKAGRGVKNFFTKKKNTPDNVVDGDFEVVEDDVFEDEEEVNG